MQLLKRLVRWTRWIMWRRRSTRVMPRVSPDRLYARGYLRKLYAPALCNLDRSYSVSRDPILLSRRRLLVTRRRIELLPEE